jgi:hypothetical protein
MSIIEYSILEQVNSKHILSPVAAAEEVGQGDPCPEIAI